MGTPYGRLFVDHCVVVQLLGLQQRIGHDPDVRFHFLHDPGGPFDQGKHLVRIVAVLEPGFVPKLYGIVFRFPLLGLHVAQELGQVRPQQRFEPGIAPLDSSILLEIIHKLHQQGIDE